jgi:hypothetical protein
MDKTTPAAKMQSILQERRLRRQEGLKKQRSGQLDDDVRWEERRPGGYDAGCGEQVL